jgi:putative membrane protein insertion efficiency factor
MTTEAGSLSPSTHSARHSVLARTLKVLLVLYRGATAHRSPACRFVPSCSGYALEALDRFGARKGLPLVLRRLVRCRPGGPFGFDPVPDGPAETHAAPTIGPAIEGHGVHK